MTPERLSAQKPTRVSFARLLLSKMIRERWSIYPVSVDLDEDGRGRLVYRIRTAERDLHVLVLSDKLPREEQSDRAIATRWDMALALIEGELTDERAERIFDAPPRDGGSGADPRLGRVDALTLLWVCANRSSRIFDHTVDALAAGRQPDPDMIASASYIVRGINYVANGMMGTRMIDEYEEDHPLRSPYFAQMLGCYIVREVSCDLVDAIARRRSRHSATMSQELRSFVGVGNSTGVGLGLMINRHPILMDGWIRVRETALALSKARPVDAIAADRFLAVLDRCIRYREEDPTDPGFFTPSTTIASELQHARDLALEYRAVGTMAGESSAEPWRQLCDLTEAHLSPESQETLNSLIIELYPEIAEQLAPHQMIDEAYDVVPEMSVAELRDLVASEYGWAMDWDLGAEGERHWLWYRTAAGGEPRVTPASGADDETGRNVALDLIGEIQALVREVSSADPNEPVGLMVTRRPRLRAITERVQSAAGLRYHSPIMNMLARDFVPINLGRFVLWALKGMEKPSPRNDIWIRGVMMQGTPTSQQIAAGTTDDWVYPPRPTS